MEEVKVEAEVASFRIVTTSEDPVNVEISGLFTFAERAKVLFRCTAMVYSKPQQR